MTAEDSSWSTVGSGNEIDTKSGVGSKQMEEVAALKDELKAMRTENDKLIQAIIRTDTLLDELDSCAGSDVRETIEILFNCSITMNIPELKKKAAQFAKHVLEKSPLHAISVFLAIENNDDFVEKELANVSLEKIRTNPSMLISNEEMTLVSEDQITSFLSDKDMDATEGELCNIVATWVGSSEKRRLVARERLLKHIDLSSIPLCELGSDEIRGSGIVTDTEVLDAILKQHAQGLLTISSSVTVKNSIGELVWSKAQESKLCQVRTEWKYDFIHRCEMQKGTYEWEVRINRFDEVFLGVTDSTFDGSFCFYSTGFVGGGIYQNNPYEARLYTKARKHTALTMKISENSVLKFRLKYGDSFSVFFGDSTHADETISWNEMGLRGDSCIPFVGLRGHSSVDLVSFTRFYS